MTRQETKSKPLHETAEKNPNILGTKPADPQSNAYNDENVGAWVRAAQAGDVDAFEALVRHFQNRIFGTASRMLNNREDAAEVAQEVFLKLYKSIGQFEGRSRFSTWLFTMTVNMCRNRRRTLARRSVEKQILDIPQYDDEGASPRDVEDPSAGPREIAGHHDIRALVDKGLQTLPDEYREAVVLRDLQYMTYDDIAAALEISIGTVKSRIARGRALLKTQLTKVLKEC
jgi:RNA polymerase sigma-70 factor, ECF subfamily